MRYTFIFCLFPLFLNAQLLIRTGDLTRFSVEFGLGRVSSFQYADEYNECDFGGCEQILNGRIFNPARTTYFSGLTNFHLTEIHQIGMGLVISQQGFRTSFATRTGQDYFYDHEWSYVGIKIKHRVDFLQSSKLKLGLANSIDMNFRLNTNWFYGLKDKGISHTAECLLVYAASRHFECYISFLYRTALSRYGIETYKGPFHRFGTGLLLGMEYRLGKVKYHSPNKQ